MTIPYNRTRKAKAIVLLKRLHDGPSLYSKWESRDLLLRRNFAEDYKLWSETWIIPDVLELIPELRRLTKKELEKLLKLS